MVTSVGLDPARCLQQGLANFKYFPFVRYWDENRNRKSTWNRKDFIELQKANEIPSAASHAAPMQETSVLR